jgi:ABC-type sugar transport system ATPase subunit
VSGGGALSLALPEGLAADAARVTLGVRAEDVALVSPGAGNGQARVDVLENLGADTLVHLSLPGAGDAKLVARVDAERAPAVGATVGVALAEGRLHWFDAEGARIEPRAGAPSPAAARA